MNPAQLLEHFDRISETPDAVARLRRFILDLAVRGKLVEQDPNDEPAAELLKRIQAEKARLVKEGSARKEKSRAPLAADELPFPIPKGWQWSQLAEIGFISPRNDVDGAIPTSFVPMTLIPADYGIPHKHEIRPWGEIKTGYTHFADGDVGLAKITPCFENGKSTVFRSLTGGIGAGTTELHIVRPLLVDADYVLLFLKCPYFIESGIPRMTGTAGQKRVSADYFAHSPFPLPPLAEQRRIVAKVNELMALCDQLEAAKNEREARRDQLVAASLHRIGTTPAAEGAAQDEAKTAAALRQATRFHLDHLPRLTIRPEHIKQLRRTILNLAVRGRLVPQDPNDEPAAELLKRITIITGRQAIIGRGQEDQPAFVLPPSWAWSRVGLITTKTGSGSTPRGGQSVYQSTGVPFLRSQNVYNDGLRMDDVAYIDQSTHTKMRGTAIEPGDLLLNITGGSIGRCCLIPDGPIEANISQHVAIIRLAVAGMREFMHKVVLSPFFQSFVMDEQTGAGRGGLPKNRMDQIPVPVPPLAEQQRIVAKVVELMALCDQLEVQLTATQADSRRLLEAVLRDALAPALEKAA